jgi:hypothetical protein
MKNNDSFDSRPPVARMRRTRPPVRLLVAALATATGAGALSLVASTAPASADSNQTLDFGVVAPGSWTSRTADFVATATGSVMASATPGYQAADLETYHMQRERVDVDPGELPPGAHPKPVFEEVRVVDQHVDGSGPLAVTAGQHFSIDVDAEPTSATSGLIVGTLSYSGTGGSGEADLHMFAGHVQVALGQADLSVPQGRTATLPVTVRSLGGPATDVTLDLWDAIPGITVLDPVVHVGPWQTVNTFVHIAAGRVTTLGSYDLHMSATAFDGIETEGASGDLNLTVTPLPVLNFSVGLGQVASAWDQARSSNCEVIKDLMGRAVVAAIGRTIRDPDCYLAPLELSATQDGGTVNLEASAPGNWVSAYVTTPDGLPSVLDPKFSLNYGVSAGLSINLPQTLDADTRLRISDPSLVLNDVYLDSHDLTADIIEAAASWFGGAQYFQPASIALTPYLSGAVNDVNAVLANLDPVLQQAAATGFTRIDVSLDGGTLDLKITLT